MGQMDVCPLKLGDTLKGTDADGNLINSHWLGKEFYVPFEDPTGGSSTPAKRLVGKMVKVVLLRNTSGAALLGARIGKMDATAGYKQLTDCKGYGTVLADSLIVGIDGYLPSAGVASNDIFCGITQGPMLVYLPTVNNDHNGDITVGADLVCATGATSGNSTSGRVSNVTLAGQTAATASFNMARNLFAVALSAATTAQTTGVSILVDVKLANRL